MQNGQTSYQPNGVIPVEEYLLLKKENAGIIAENLYLKQELAHLKRMIFGSKSECFVPTDTGQLSLNLDIEQQEPGKVETERVSYTRKKPDKKKGKPARLPLPSHLHREEIVINPRGDISGAKKIGEEITEILEYTPGKFYVGKYVRPKFLLPTLCKALHNVGRKNYLFAGSHEAAKQAAMIYSFLGTCKLNKVEPFQWLKKILSSIPDHSIHKLDELLPGNQQV